MLSLYCPSISQDTPYASFVFPDPGLLFCRMILRNQKEPDTTERLSTAQPLEIKSWELDKFIVTEISLSPDALREQGNKFACVSVCTYTHIYICISNHMCLY